MLEELQKMMEEKYEALEREKRMTIALGFKYEGLIQHPAYAEFKRDILESFLLRPTPVKANQDGMYQAFKEAAMREALVYPFNYLERIVALKNKYVSEHDGPGDADLADDV